MQMVKKLRSIIAKICVVAPKGEGRGIGGGEGRTKGLKGGRAPAIKKPLTLNHAHYFPTNLITSTVNYTIVQD